jgi:hypothetical protein
MWFYREFRYTPSLTHSQQQIITTMNFVTMTRGSSTQNNRILSSVPNQSCWNLIGSKRPSSATQIIRGRPIRSRDHGELVKLWWRLQKWSCFTGINESPHPFLTNSIDTSEMHRGQSTLSQWIRQGNRVEISTSCNYVLAFIVTESLWCLYNSLYSF